MGFGVGDLFSIIGGGAWLAKEAVNEIGRKILPTQNLSKLLCQSIPTLNLKSACVQKSSQRPLTKKSGQSLSSTKGIILCGVGCMNRQGGVASTQENIMNRFLAGRMSDKSGCLFSMTREPFAGKTNRKKASFRPTETLCSKCFWRCAEKCERTLR